MNVWLVRVKSEAVIACWLVCEELQPKTNTAEPASVGAFSTCRTGDFAIGVAIPPIAESSSAIVAVFEMRLHSAAPQPAQSRLQMATPFEDLLPIPLAVELVPTRQVMWLTVHGRRRLMLHRRKRT